MIQGIETAIGQMEQIPWLVEVGREEQLPLSAEVTCVHCWKDAISRRSHPSASAAFSIGRGMLTRALSAEFRTDYRSWNRITHAARELMEDRICPSFDRVIDQTSELKQIASASEFVKHSIRWDLVHFVLEQAYASLVEPRFYTQVFEVYRGGHFPCDWNRVWPSGQLCIF